MLKTLLRPSPDLARNSDCSGWLPGRAHPPASWNATRIPSLCFGDSGPLSASEGVTIFSTQIPPSSEAFPRPTPWSAPSHHWGLHFNTIFFREAFPDSHIQTRNHYCSLLQKPSVFFHGPYPQLVFSFMWSGMVNVILTVLSLVSSLASSQCSDGINKQITPCSILCKANLLYNSVSREVPVLAGFILPFLDVHAICRRTTALEIDSVHVVEWPLC